MRIAAVSDTHNRHAALEVPKGADLLVHAGDACVKGTRAEAEDFLQWLEAAAARTALGAVYVPGNHDLWMRDLWSGGERLPRVPGVRILIGEQCVVGGVRFFGSPWTPWPWPGRANRWAFHYDRSEADARWRPAAWAALAADVWVTHGPPLGILDQAGAMWGKANAGCPGLLAAVLKANRVGGARLHIFGHIHNGRGRATLRPQASAAGALSLVNAACCDDDYRLAHGAQLVTLRQAGHA